MIILETPFISWDKERKLSGSITAHQNNTSHSIALVMRKHCSQNTSVNIREYGF